MSEYGPLMDLRLKLTKAQKEIDRLQILHLSRTKSTHKAFVEYQERIDKLEDLLAKVWNIGRDNNLEYRARIDKIMSTIREKP